MAWARLDDRFHDNRKIKRVWRRCPAAVGLHVMAITYSAGHLTDGFIDTDFVEDRMPTTKQRDKAVECLIDAGLWHPADEGWVINDFAEFNMTREAAAAKHAAKAEAGRKGALARWGDSNDMAGAMAADSSSHDGSIANDAPDPTRTFKEANASSSGAERADKESRKATDDDLTNCRLFGELARSRNPKVKIPKAKTGEWATWLREMRLLRSADENSPADIERVIRWLFTDPSQDAMFWGTTIQAPSGLREHFAQVWGKMNAAPLRSVPKVESSADYLARRQGVA
jgi:hypothetical protein